MRYQTLNHQIDEQALTLLNANGIQLNIRPKSCQLLLLLVANAGIAISKQRLLETVWADSIVSEQVVFQSINEIRQLFPNEQVIKTIPKQGYLWLPEVTLISDVNESKATGKSMRNTLVALAALAVIYCSYLFIPQANSLLNQAPQTQQKISGSIVILPVANQIEGNDHNWVRLGMMDQVIQRLPNDDERGVLQTDYVFEVLKRAKAPLNNILPQHIRQVFTISGAELVVFSKLSGSPHDYQLNYTFHYRNRLKKGVLFNSNIQYLIDEFSLLVAAQLGKNVLPMEIAYQADFNNELLGNAIEKRLSGDFESANVMLQSVVFSNPKNLTAQRMLVKNLFSLRRFEQVSERLAVALPIAQQLNDKVELSRLLYLKALLMYVTYDDQNAADFAIKALANATENKDWLLMARIKNLQAAVAINEKNYQRAETLYREEMQHHQVLGCPAGEAQSWAYLARLAKHQNRPDKFNATINQAITIAQTRELNSQLEYFIKIREQGFN